MTKLNLLSFVLLFVCSSQLFAQGGCKYFEDFKLEENYFQAERTAFYGDNSLQWNCSVNIGATFENGKTAYYVLIEPSFGGETYDLVMAKNNDKKTCLNAQSKLKLELANGESLQLNYMGTEAHCMETTYESSTLRFYDLKDARFKLSPSAIEKLKTHEVKKVVVVNDALKNHPLVLNNESTATITKNFADKGITENSYIKEYLSCLTENEDKVLEQLSGNNKERESKLTDCGFADKYYDRSGVIDTGLESIFSDFQRNDSGKSLTNNLMFNVKAYDLGNDQRTIVVEVTWIIDEGYKYNNGTMTAKGTEIFIEKGDKMYLKLANGEVVECFYTDDESVPLRYDKSHFNTYLKKRYFVQEVAYLIPTEQVPKVMANKLVSVDFDSFTFTDGLKIGNDYCSDYEDYLITYDTYLQRVVGCVVNK